MAPLGDNSVRLVENIHTVSGVSVSVGTALAEMRKPGESDITSGSVAGDGCVTVTSTLNLLHSDCSCVVDIHKACDAAEDQQCCLRKYGCSRVPNNPCDDWHT